LEYTFSAFWFRILKSGHISHHSRLLNANHVDPQLFSTVIHRINRDWNKKQKEIDHRASASPSTPMAPITDTVSPVACAAPPVEVDAIPLALPLPDPVDPDSVAPVAVADAVAYAKPVVAVNAPPEICDLTTDM
jgi:hypothetical protein